jgi:hypothetical protein
LKEKSKINETTEKVLKIFRAEVQKWEALLGQEGINLVEIYEVFKEKAFDDLCYLTSQGANPIIIMNIIFSDFGVGKHSEDYERRRIKERRRLTSKVFWGKQKRNLEKAAQVLTEFTKSEIYLQWSHFYSRKRGQNRLGRVCRKMRRADEAVNAAVKMITDLNLESGSWIIDYRIGGPNLKKTVKKGREKSGRAQARDWTVCGAELVTYLANRTGKPRYGPVCRLLRAAGSPDFVDGRPDDIDRLRMRIKRLGDNEVELYAIKARLTDYERIYETRRPILYDDIGTLIGNIEIIGGDD